ncbi:MAG TPA: ABC transporter substrate-binding protein [Dehalococcoidia bacterium]|nr:ABC transporter substrate-binding protein [Dehalococcoidia bacterium]
MWNDEGRQSTTMPRRTSRRRFLVGGAGVTGSAAFLFACGGGSKNNAGNAGAAGNTGSAKPAASAAGGQAKATAAAETPKPGGILTQVFFTDPSPNLDMHQTTTYTAVWPLSPCFNQLVQFDTTKPDDAQQDIVADLAEKWEQPDDTSTVFTLRKDAKWHDGADFTSEDVKATLEWLKKPFKPDRPSPRSGTQVTVDEVQVPDPYTVKVKFSRPTASYIMNLATAYFAMGQSKDLHDNGEIGANGKLIGTGPFKLKNYQRANITEVEKNPAYHIAGRPYLDGIKSFILPDYTTRLTNLIAGQYHIFFASEFVKTDQERVKQEAGGKYDTFSIPGFNHETVFMNATRMPYKDMRVRQAISLAMDRDAAINVVKQGQARRGAYMAPQGVWAIGEAELRAYDGYDKPDVQKAKQLLQAAGVTTPLDASATSRTDFQTFAEFVKDQLAKIGINLKLTLADTATAQPVLIRGDFDIGPWTIGINVDDPDATFSEIAISKAARNWSHVYDDQIDQLYDKQSATFDFQERKKIVQDLERRALSQYQVAVLYFQASNHALAKSVRNYVIHQSLYSNRRMDQVWLKT